MEFTIDYIGFSAGTNLSLHLVSFSKAGRSGTFKYIIGQIPRKSWS